MICPLLPPETNRTIRVETHHFTIIFVVLTHARQLGVHVTFHRFTISGFSLYYRCHLSPQRTRRHKDFQWTPLCLHVLCNEIQNIYSGEMIGWMRALNIAPHTNAGLSPQGLAQNRQADCIWFFWRAERRGASRFWGLWSSLSIPNSLILSQIRPRPSKCGATAEPVSWIHRAYFTSDSQAALAFNTSSATS